MCGIFGVTIKENSTYGIKDIKSITDALFELSETRGKEASGLAVIDDNEIKVYKQPIRAKELIRQKKYKKLLEGAKPKAIIGHARLVTNGKEDESKNNQPAIKSGQVAVHNGIIVNVDHLWQKNLDLKKETDLDSEVILALLNKYIMRNKDIVLASYPLFKDIKGTASIAVLFDSLDCLMLATNNGSLYLLNEPEKGINIFASEYYILKKLNKKYSISNNKIRHIEANEACLFDLEKDRIENFSLIGEVKQGQQVTVKKRTIINLAQNKEKLIYRENKNIGRSTFENLEKYYNEKKSKVAELKRCTKCVLPGTMPFIEFDESGTCNYCQNYKKVKIYGKEKLEEQIVKVRSKKNQADCLLMFSGGRDSCYALYVLKKELNLNPIAYSYDWGMLTDLGRRNQARLCGQLGVEHIIISPDIRKKRANIRKNVLAWLKKPDLGTVPLFMAGDKQFFYHGYKLRKINKLPITIQGNNPYERTYFKYGFSSVDRFFKHKKSLGLTPYNKIKLGWYYTKQFIVNPAYINYSLADTLTAYLSYYFVPRDYIPLFRYIKWNEEEVNRVLIGEYDWELAPDTSTTWRIGDGTAAFYNYIYYMFAGFTENDTFRSNQIREGRINREKAMEYIDNENKPRFDSIKWYCDTINIDFEKTIQAINKAVKNTQ